MNNFYQRLFIWEIDCNYQNGFPIFFAFYNRYSYILLSFINSFKFNLHLWNLEKKKEYNDRNFFFYNGKGPVDLVLLGGIYSKNYLSEKHKYSSLQLK